MAEQTSSNPTPHPVFSNLLKLLNDIPDPDCSRATPFAGMSGEESGTTDQQPSGLEMNSCLKCNNCRYKIRLVKLKGDILYIQEVLQKQSEFEQSLRNHTQTLEDRVATEGCRLPESALRELTTAVMQLKFQLPSKSYHNFQDTDGNPMYSQLGDDAPGPSEPPSELKEKYESADFGEQKKKCLWCFSVFDGEVKKRVLINWWIGQGLIGPSTGGEGRTQTSEQAGEELLQSLEKDQFIQQVKKENRRVDRWMMPSSVRSFLREDAKAAKFFDFTGDTADAEVILLKSSERMGKLDDQTKTVYNIHKSNVADTEAEALAYTENLRVLQLGRCQITQPKRIIRIKELKLIMRRLHKMKNLRLLSLPGILSLRELPGSVGGVTNLTVLDLSDCQALDSLPSAIGKLKRLTHLDVSSCALLLQMPKEISLLSNLEVLKGFVVGRDTNPKIGRLKHLQKLKKLYKLSIVVRKENFPQPQELQDLQSLEGLVKLKIVWNPSSLSSGSQLNGNTVETTQDGQRNSASAVNEQEVERVVDNHTQQSQAQYEQEVRRDAQDQNQQGSRENADADVNEEIEVEGSDVDSQQSLENDDTAQDSSFRPEKKLGESLALLPLLLFALFTPCLGNRVKTENRHVASNLEKLDLWCAPDDKLLHAPSKYPKLKKLYIRGIKFNPLNIPEAEGKWQNVETVRLLYIPDLPVKDQQGDLKCRLFPNLSYMEYKQPQGLQTSDVEDCVWVKEVNE